MQRRLWRRKMLRDRRKGLVLSYSQTSDTIERLFTTDTNWMPTMSRSYCILFVRKIVYRFSDTSQFELEIFWSCVINYSLWRFSFEQKTMNCILYYYAANQKFLFGHTNKIQLEFHRHYASIKIYNWKSSTTYFTELEVRFFRRILLRSIRD